MFKIIRSFIYRTFHPKPNRWQDKTKTLWPVWNMCLNSDTLAHGCDSTFEWFGTALATATAILCMSKFYEQSKQKKQRSCVFVVSSYSHSLLNKPINAFFTVCIPPISQCLVLNPFRICFFLLARSHCAHTHQITYVRSKWACHRQWLNQ